tara:strand:+ start:1162 stop:1554 length:393 start_codon:yes stop_codon:yes gene_type:complete
MRRREFLQEYLGALGASEVRWQEEATDKISGTVIYEVDDPEETQDFVWHKSEKDVPGLDVLNLVKLIRKHNLLSIDRLTVTTPELGRKYNSEYGLQLTEQEFLGVLESLKGVEVPMVDEGRETDAYFIHE